MAAQDGQMSGTTTLLTKAVLPPIDREVRTIGGIAKVGEKELRGPLIVVNDSLAHQRDVGRALDACKISLPESKGACSLPRLPRRSVSTPVVFGSVSKMCLGHQSLAAAPTTCCAALLVVIVGVVI